MNQKALFFWPFSKCKSRVIQKKMRAQDEHRLRPITRDERYLYTYLRIMYEQSWQLMNRKHKFSRKIRQIILIIIFFLVWCMSMLVLCDEMVITMRTHKHQKWSLEKYVHTHKIQRPHDVNLTVFSSSTLCYFCFCTTKFIRVKIIPRIK